MRKYLILLFTFLCTQMLGVAQTGYHISIHIDGMNDSTVYLAHHYGNMQVMDDTLLLDSKGNGVFSGDNKLAGGMYMIALPPDNHFFELVIDDDQDLSLSTKEPDLVDNMLIKGSRENKLFYEDLHFIKSKRAAYMHAVDRKNALDPEADSLAIYEETLKEIDLDVRTHRSQFEKDYPDLLYTKILLSTPDPEVPEPARDSAGNLIDSYYVYHYYINHFFDNYDFTDLRLLYTPVYHRKLNDYINKWTVQYPDSIIVAIDRVLAKAKENKEVFKYTVAYMLNKYASNKIMGMDAVYVHIAEKYYLSGEADWVDADQLEKIRTDALSLKPLLLGKVAPNVIVKDRSGNWQALHDIKAKYTILYFWDSDCGTCRKETPKLYDYYEKVKQKDVEVFAVSIELIRSNWETFIDEHKLTDWINCIDDKEESNFRSIYNIKGTPIIFLLDKDKKIIAKRLNAEQTFQYLDRLMKEDQ